ncbi:MAG: DedA family protein [Firmicutes bacterium]|nr:DedA family protein [Bacillota bacterium]
MQILAIITTYRYIGLFILLALEYFILIVPGETELTTAGALTRIPHYHLAPVPVILATGLGTFAGAMIAYGLGRWLGRPFIVKYGKYVFLTEARLQRSESLFQKYTILTIVVSRYIAFVRDIVPYVAGINRVKLRIFVPVLLLSSLLWTTSFVLLGGVVVEAVHWILAHWKQDTAFIVVAVLVTVGLYLYIHRKLR